MSECVNVTLSSDVAEGCSNASYSVEREKESNEELLSIILDQTQIAVSSPQQFSSSFPNLSLLSFPLHRAALHFLDDLGKDLKAEKKTFIIAVPPPLYMG